jgi:predicted regulator of Ras-like GTPase activity (Roadblock/LC7/MglB family)
VKTRAELVVLVDRLRAPLREFVRESRVRMAVLVNSSGQLLAQQGFSRGYEVTNVASLAAAAHAAAAALAEMTGARRWTHLHNEGRNQHMLLAPYVTGGVDLILVAIFDRSTSLGIVRLFSDRLGDRLAAMPELQAASSVRDATRFEQELEGGVRRVMGERA